MKKKICFITNLLAAFIFITSAGAQVSVYERTPGYYTFGINAGLAYQQADIPTTLEGYGVGMTLAKNLYYQPGALFSFDIRGRALYSETRGLDHFRSYGIQDNDALNGTQNLDYTIEGGGPGFVFQNNKTNHAELGLEGVIHFNKLREKTNVNLSLFGGIGIDWYNAHTDQSNRQGLYSDQYLALDTLASTSFLKKELKNAILDGDYETTANEYGRLGIMPNLGIELGYQFSPRFSMGIGHKVTFTKTDLFDGHQWENDGGLTAKDDIHHYTNLHLRWIIDDNSRKLRAPIVDITNPSLSPHTTRNPTFDIRATVKNISSAMDIQFTVNGYRETFNFRKKDFRSLINLRPGNNEVVITATNNAGSDSDVVNIFYQGPIIDTRPEYTYPDVQITNPPYDNYATDQDRFDVRANVLNVSNRRDIEVTVNGRLTNNFEFRNGSLSARVDLERGRNLVRISANNSDGFASDETTIILEEQVNERPPSVDITTPSVDPYYTNIRNVTVEANVYNIENKNDIRMTINGYDNYDFTFTNNTVYTNIDINDDRTVVVITGTNNAGQDSDTVTILWEEEGEGEPIDKPIVTITSTSQPTADPFDPTNCKSTVIATILNIEDRNDIDVYVNGQNFVDYDFNSNTQVLRATVRLVQGTNEIRIVARNSAGTDEDITRTAGCATQGNEKNPPVVEITQPTQDNQKVTKASTTVKATVLNVTSKSEIDFEINGQSFYGFTFDKFSNQVTANITLEKGNNTVFIGAENEDGTASDQTNIIYQEIEIIRPPQVTIQKPFNNSIVENSEVELIATVKNITSKNDIQVFLNGNAISNFSYSNRKLEVKANLTLTEGNNTIRVIATNNGGSDEASVNVKYQAPVIDAPVVNIQNPQDNITVNTTSVSLTAEVLNVTDKRDISVRVNDRTINDFTFSRNKVNATISLRAGTNTIIVKARNDGGSDQDQVIVSYQLPVKKVPVVQITKPANNSTTSTPNVRVEARIEHIVNKSGITFMVNGKRINGFNYQRGIFTADVKLQTGKNNIIVKARNTDGEDQDAVIVTYIVPQQPPTVQITAPRNNQTFEQSAVQISANINNETNKRNISLKVNGKSQRFNFKGGKLTATTTLNIGKNTISVSVNNRAGSDQASVTVMHTPKVEVPKPLVRFTNPSKAGGTTEDNKFTLKATVKNVTDKKGITLKLNGRKVSKFTFDTRTNLVTANLTLKNGKNTFFIEGQNSTGKDKKETSVTYKRPIEVVKTPPKVTIISVSNPTIDPFDPNKAKSTVIAKLENISSTKQITFLFNGKKTTKYSFDKKSGNLQATLDLKKGKNTFEIKVSNKDGSDSAKRDIQFGDTPGNGGTSSRHGNPKDNNKDGKVITSRRTFGQ